MDIHLEQSDEHSVLDSALYEYLAFLILSERSTLTIDSTGIYSEFINQRLFKEKRIHLDASDPLFEVKALKCS